MAKAAIDRYKDHPAVLAWGIGNEMEGYKSETDPKMWAAVQAIAADMQPTLAYAYAQGESITFAANTEGGPFGLGPATLLGMPNALEMQSIIQRGMSGKK